MKLYNTLTRKLEVFHTIRPNQVMMYACGPTVYNYIHIGNARQLIVFDCFRRYLQYRGYQVTFVQNFTDVDDKIIAKAKEQGKTAAEIAEQYIREYQKDAAGLGVLPADRHPRVTDSIEQIIGIVEKLIENGYAYQINGDVYFRTRHCPEYGKLSHMPLEELEAGSRVEVSGSKEDPLDFAVWKAAKPGEPFWESPWGKGRPGWHIECSAMATHYLAPTIDIHCGGQDLIFPHHENEIAQSECATGAPFAHYWMHNGYINIDNRKMSKSLGNFFTVREVAEQYGYLPIRYMMLQAHYRSPINYSEDVIVQCRASLERIETFRRNLEFALSKVSDGEMSDQQKDAILANREKFIRVMDDDFNTADGITAIFELIREMNPFVTGKEPTGKEHLAFAKKIFFELTGVLGLLPESVSDETPSEIQRKFEEWVTARNAKDFEKADSLREELYQKGYLAQTTRQGNKLTRRTT